MCKLGSKSRMWTGVMKKQFWLWNLAEVAQLLLNCANNRS